MSYKRGIRIFPDCPCWIFHETTVGVKEKKNYLWARNSDIDMGLRSLVLSLKIFCERKTATTPPSGHVTLPAAPQTRAPDVSKCLQAVAFEFSYTSRNTNQWLEYRTRLERGRKFPFLITPMVTADSMRCTHANRENSLHHEECMAYTIQAIS